MAYCGFISDSCCCCLPLRGGLIAYGYFRLVIMVLLASLVTFLLTYVHMVFSPWGMGIVGGFTIEIALTIVFIVGAHSEKTLILKIFIWHFILSTIFSIVIFFVLQYLNVRDDEDLDRFLIWISQIVFVLVIASQIYVAVCVRNLIVKREEGDNYKPLNNETVIDDDVYNRSRA